MIDYTASEAEIAFVLKHIGRPDRLPDWNDDLAEVVIPALARFINTEIAPLDMIGEDQGARLENGRVRMPPEMVAAYQRYSEAGWPGLCAPEPYGGQELPHILGAVLADMLAGACISYEMVLSLAQGCIRTISASGNDDQKARLLPPLVSGEWMATMCLTEPDAGSDLGRIKTTATPDDNGYALSGTKIFISGGDHDYTDNILHLVLARAPDAAPGMRGLSLFACPAVLPDGTRNTVQTVRIEEKMGMHASPTCQMAFDAARGELLGEEGKGLAAMFTMMNAERLDVALQAVGQMDVAFQRARTHATGRRQGTTAKGVSLITEHGDVQRMLLDIYAYAMGCRAMVYRTFVDMDLGADQALLDILTPTCKAFATDAVNAASSQAVQIHGGYGFCKEYRVEQIMRDSRIMAIYEGTNGVLATGIARRAIRANGGAAADAFADLVENGPSSMELADAIDAWKAATRVMQSTTDIGPSVADYMRLTGLVYFGRVWADMEAAADAAPEPELLRAAAAHVRSRILPEAGLLRQRILNPEPTHPAAIFAA
ncbi:acyl-CoA dehydrogenase family protein [Ruegeria sp. R14_0]|uniref:acyl-CoA dehydrogenase family protein n=1 Tax=Ruegeria sp. R14_0 TaxID=2821100 RepID=UPI001ADA22A3|nr:acyl-CoA dehydrogenase family protein [Ruegeria sp. R14_0]MBO9446761.1 acyl-CoA dehydrogenase family protein [Ruegeria sp. R14_0]